MKKEQAIEILKQAISYNEDGSLQKGSWVLSNSGIEAVKTAIYSLEHISFLEYQEASKRTINTSLNAHEQLINSALGLAGESGEVIDHIKKYAHQGHTLSTYAIMEELGDVLWYIAEMCSALGTSMNQVAIGNIVKLKNRYPEKFSTDNSINRTE